VTVETGQPGRRAVTVSVELPGTPEQVWQAIATGPGFTAWFVPTEVEEREGGAVVFHLGPDMDSHGRVTVWEPPHRITYEEAGWNGDAPPLATEVTVETRGGGTCTVRMVHSLFTESDAWDRELEGMQSGWPPFFAVLRLYLAHWPGRHAASIRPTGGFAGTEAEAWEAVTAALGLTGAKPGERRRAPDGAPALAGAVENVTGDPRHHEVMLRLAAPAPGAGLIGSYEYGGKVRIAISLYIYGDDADAVVAREQPRWDAWLAERFPQPSV
jgi:uncharacterized protein YndB with AHSA1/START domain